MDRTKLLELLNKVSGGKIDPSAAVDELRHMSFDEMDFAKVDGHRHLRNGFSEVIYCKGKTTEQVLAITEKMADNGMNVLGTRADAELLQKVAAKFLSAKTDGLSQTFQLISHDITPIKGKLAVLAAGTADLKVAEEARITAQFFGAEAKQYYDVGVAGIHRLFAHIKELKEYDVLIAVAGMEGALPSVLGGLIEKPIIAVPTSVGYGSNFGGITPLLAMLNSCSEGITVVNIDNGFGAACAALRILR